MGDWISVDDKLPEQDQLIISHHYDYGYDFTKFNGDYWTRNARTLGYVPQRWIPIPEVSEEFNNE